MVKASAQSDGHMSILAAARDAFGEYGFNATTTRTIATRAGVSEPTVFRRFGTKEALFDAAILTPFTEFLDRRITDWSRREPGSLPALEETRLLYGELVGLFLEERRIVVALLAVYHYGDASPDLTRRLERAMHQIIRLIQDRVVDEARIRGNTGFDIHAVVRVMVGMAFSIVTLPRLFATDKLARSRLIEEMARLTLYGTEFRDQPLKDERSPQGPDPTPTTSSGDLGDDTWSRIVPLMAGPDSGPRPGKKRVDDRTVLEAILAVRREGTGWSALPTNRFGVSGTTCWRRLREWQDTGVWEDILREVERR